MPMSDASQGSDRNRDSQWISLEPSGPSDARTFKSWWQRYEHQLHAGGLSKTAVTVIRADCEYIVDSGVLRYGQAGDDRWPSGRLMSGLVMGAVQSGKTASMIGVVACALDRGINHIVILGGRELPFTNRRSDALSISWTLEQSHGHQFQTTSCRSYAQILRRTYLALGQRIISTALALPTTAWRGKRDDPW